ncbi:MAG TPA: hypothetical protein VGK34_10280 [Armatimonadota bacterium]|jgi:hypothetical protein
MHKFAIIILPDNFTLNDPPTSLYAAANELMWPYKVPHHKEPKYDEYIKPIWDWWILGGHWNSKIRGIEVEPPGCLAAFFPNAHGSQDVIQNTINVRDIPEGLIPQVLVTPKGEWLVDPKAPEEEEKPKSKEAYPEPPPPSDKWERRVRFIFNENANNVAIGADVHFPDYPPILPDWARGK